ncbi:PREDICTED: cystatin-A-like [Acropora digitifera]|uniref:cystatin-A-like n=1 Tax=Acropora digitifera TaxID=70779 RepID=UPI00077A5D9E|nr:PREDICTED: cystatin-A-like [Acropora digitifera]
MDRPGAYTEERKAAKEVQKICDQVKDQAEAKAGTTFDKFQAISYRSQVVAGTNYIIKVNVGDTPSNYVHLYVYEKLPCDGSALTVTNIKTGMKESDPLEPIK